MSVFFIIIILCQDSYLQPDSPVNTTRRISRRRYIYFDGLCAWWQRRRSVSITDGVIDMGNGAWDWRWLPCVCVCVGVRESCVPFIRQAGRSGLLTPPRPLQHNYEAQAPAPVIDARQ